MKATLDRYPVSKPLRELVPNCAEQLPDGFRFEDDIWNILAWKTRKGNARVFNLDYTDFKNRELKEVAKIFILHRRLTLRIGMHAAYNYLYSVKFLDKTVLKRNVADLTNGDFRRTEQHIKDTTDSAHRLCDFLAQFGEWLNTKLGLSISYVSGVHPIYKHGRKGTEEGRQKKLIHTQVIRDMLEANARKDLSDKDRFFLSAFVILTATGFRINELATLPKDCLQFRDGDYSIQYFPEKVRRMATRFIPQPMVPAVRVALDYIIALTEPGREAVRKLREDPGLDWPAILQDKSAVEYFVAKFAHEWTARPRNRMINPDGVWLEKEQRIVDVLSLVEQAGSKSETARRLGVSRATVDGLVVAQQNARRGLLPCTIASRGKAVRTEWDTDTRVISMLRFIDHCDIGLRMNKREMFRHIIDEAQRLQLEGKVYPAPTRQPSLEGKYSRTIRPVVEDANGKALLAPEDTLFIVPRYLFSEARGTKEGDYRLISDNAISRWFNGEARSHDTGNHEDSCFTRLGIIDPKTEELAKFTAHDVRHWLNTVYAEGHMDEQTIALIFNRKKGANHTYDQTSKMVRLERVREDVREGKSLGQISENYQRLAEFSREDAEEYLLAGTRMVNIMPHGACTLSWGMEACPNHLSCFAGNGKGCCEHLHIDLSDPEQLDEVRRIGREIEATLDYMPEESPQHGHYRGIKHNIAALLARS